MLTDTPTAVVHKTEKINEFYLQGKQKNDNKIVILIIHTTFPFVDLIFDSNYGIKPMKMTICLTHNFDIYIKFRHFNDMFLVVKSVNTNRNFVKTYTLSRVWRKFFSECLENTINGCPRNNEPPNILLISLSKLIRSRLTFFSKDRSFQALQDDICLFF